MIVSEMYAWLKFQFGPFKATKFHVDMTDSNQTQEFFTFTYFFQLNSKEKKLPQFRIIFFHNHLHLHVSAVLGGQ